MFRRAFLAALLAATPVLAQPVAAPDCTVDGRLTESDGLRLDVAYRCRANQPVSFRLVEERASSHLRDLKVEQRDGVAEAHYRLDLSGLARAVNSTSLAVQRGDGALAVLGSWLLEPQGYDRAPTIDIRMETGPVNAGKPSLVDEFPRQHVENFCCGRKKMRCRVVRLPAKRNWMMVEMNAVALGPR